MTNSDLCDEKLASSLSAQDVQLLPFIPYLLQDIWDLGSSPEVIGSLLKGCTDMDQDSRVLDLACGKGAVSVYLAKEFGCRVLGRDLMPEFIDRAREKAVEHGVNHLCTFVLSDINQTVVSDIAYDVVVFGAAGDVLGTPDETFDKLRCVVEPHGIIVLDDAFAKSTGQGLPTREEYLNTLHRCGLRVVAERLANLDGIVAVNRRNQAFIEKRAAELSEKRPGCAPLFADYVRSQLEECQLLESALDCVTLLVTPVLS